MSACCFPKTFCTLKIDILQLLWLLLEIQQLTCGSLLVLNIFFFWSHNMWEISPLTRDWTRTLYIGSMKSKSLDTREVPQQSWLLPKEKWKSTYRWVRWLAGRRTVLPCSWWPILNPPLWRRSWVNDNRHLRLETERHPGRGWVHEMLRGCCLLRELF